MSIKETYMFTFMKEENNVLDFHLNDGHAHAKIFILEEDIIRILLTEGEEIGRAHV